MFIYQIMVNGEMTAKKRIKKRKTRVYWTDSKKQIRIQYMPLVHLFSFEFFKWAFCMFLKSFIFLIVNKYS